MTKGATVQSSGASLSTPAAGGGGGGSPGSARLQMVRAASSKSLTARTIIETATCPPELKRGDQPWSFSDFKVQKMLGEGTMSSVVHCVCGRSGVHAAIKMYHRDRMNSMNVKQVSREIEIHASLLHPNVVRLYAAFEDADGIYLVQEYASRGDLYVELSRRGGYMPEAHVVKNVLIPFFSALTYMHTQGVLHRDIKPENIMLGADCDIKVGDFGLAINTTREKPMSRVGTLDYMPPEIVKLPYGGAALSAASKVHGGEEGAAYGLPVDAWCVGVLAFELLVGAPPFEAESKEATYTRILKLEPSPPSHLPDQARDFIKQALRKDPSQRPTVHMLLRHPWLRAYQRPKSMVVLESPARAKAHMAGGSVAAPAPASPGASGAAGVATAAQLAAAHSEDQGEVSLQSASASNSFTVVVGAAAVAAVTASTAAVQAAAPPAAPPATGGAARPPTLSKSLSFSSAMAGRFSAVKPSKPAGFSLLKRHQQHSVASGGKASSDGDAAPASPHKSSSSGRSSRSGTTAGSKSASGGSGGNSHAQSAASSGRASAVANSGGETETAVTLAAAAGKPQAAEAEQGDSQEGKPGQDKLIIRVQAVSGAADFAAAEAAAPTPDNTPTAGADGAAARAAAEAAAAAAADDLIPAALPNGSRISADSSAATTTGAASSSPGTPRDSSSSQQGTSRGSFAAAIKRKLNSKGFSLFAAATAAAEGGKEEEAALAAAVAAVAAGGGSEGGGIGTIAAVQAPSLQQLLSPGTLRGGGKAGGGLKRSASSSRLLSAFGKKFSFVGGRKSASSGLVGAAAAGAAASAADEAHTADGSASGRAASRLSTTTVL